MEFNQIGTGYHILSKPVGARCNLKCEYCFYLEKKNFYKDSNFIMSNEVLETYIDKYINTQEIPVIQFVWQGGEPMLAGLEYYKNIVKIQKKHSNGKKIENSIQTNGTLLNDEWCEFLKDNDFLVGVSFDGDEDIHNKYRKDIGGNGTFSKVESGIELLKKYEIPFNVLVCVTSQSSKKAKNIYKYLKEMGVEYIQFTPIVERLPEVEEKNEGLTHASPNCETNYYLLTNFSVKQGEYGKFLIDIFDDWIKEDVGKIHVMNFEWALESWLGLPSTVCIFSKQCGQALAIEHNGDLYSCDHYVYKENKIGNILVDNPKELIGQKKQTSFGESKETNLPKQCNQCEVKFACNGECPRHRFEKAYDGEYGLSYLCSDYNMFFRYIHRYMKVMVELINNNLPASMVMDVVNNGSVVVSKK